MHFRDYLPCRADRTLRLFAGLIVATVAAQSLVTNASAQGSDSAAALVGTMQGGILGISFDKPAHNNFWVCQSEVAPPGTTLQNDDVPWVDANRVIHLNERPVVPGAAEMDSVFNVTLTADRRRLLGNGMASTPVGQFPVPAESAAYPYYAEAEQDPRSHYSGRADVPIAAVAFDISVPRNPVVADQTTCVNLAPIGIMLSGARMVDPIEVGYFDSQASLPLDNCFGHVSGSDGSYHCHAFSPACFDPGAAGKHSPLVGYALDGFGLFGPQGEDGSLITNAELDDCHGHTHAIAWDGETVDMFHYHLNYEFPYTVGCFRGTTVADPP